MKKNIKVVEKIEYILEDKDINILKDCLNYCFHRATKHKTPMTGKDNDINRLRQDLDIIETRENKKIKIPVHDCSNDCRCNRTIDDENISMIFI